MTTLSTDDELALRHLAHRYASGVDRRDGALLLSAFAPDAQLVVTSADDPERASTMRGHAEIAVVPERIRRFARTFHLVANTRYEADDDGGAHGEVYCSAHHLAGDRTHDLVMLIRYDDRYGKDDAGVWRIVERRVVVQWQDRHDVAPPRA